MQPPSSPSESLAIHSQSVCSDRYSSFSSKFTEAFSFEFTSTVRRSNRFGHRRVAANGVQLFGSEGPRIRVGINRQDRQAPLTSAFSITQGIQN